MWEKVIRSTSSSNQGQSRRPRPKRTPKGKGRGHSRRPSTGGRSGSSSRRQQSSTEVQTQSSILLFKWFPGSIHLLFFLFVWKDMIYLHYSHHLTYLKPLHELSYGNKQSYFASERVIANCFHTCAASGYPIQMNAHAGQVHKIQNTSSRLPNPCIRNSQTLAIWSFFPKQVMGIQTAA